MDPAVGADGEVVRRDARGQRRKHGRLLAGPDAKQRARPIADEHRAVPAERQAARHADLGHERRGLAPLRYPVHEALEPAGDVEQAIRPDGHRRRVDDARGERLTGPAGVHAEDRDRSLLPARAADGHVQAPAVVEHGVVDLVNAGGEWPCHLERHLPALDSRHAHRQSAARPRRPATRNDTRVLEAETTCALLATQEDGRRIAACVEQAETRVR